MRWLLRFAGLSLLSLSGQIAALPIYVDGQSREWRQVSDTAGLAWSSVAAQCSTDGATACAGSIGSVAMDGWVWANVSQVGELFRSFGDHPGGITITFAPNIVSHADEFIDTAFNQTYSDNIFRWVAGWTSTVTPGGSIWVAEVIDKYPEDPNSDIWTTADNFGPGIHPFVGFWMWRSGATVSEPGMLFLIVSAMFAGTVARKLRASIDRRERSSQS